MGLGSGTVGDVRLNTELTAEDRAIFQNSREIQSLLRQSRTIAVVGLSTEKTKASNMVASYLQDEGYIIVPVHPKADEILGEKAYRSLADIPFSIDIVNIFRPASEVQGISEQAVAIGAKAVWSQLRIIDLEASKWTREQGLICIVDRCIKMEHGRYAGALHWAGMNTELISARRN